MLIFSSFGFILTAFAICDGTPGPDNVDQHRNWNLLPPKDKCGISNQQRIVGGTQAKLGEFPWIVRIGYCRPNSLARKKVFNYQCGGTLINKYYVLTAAHCTNDTRSTIVEVRVGENMVKTDPDCYPGPRDIPPICAPNVQDIPVVKVITHEDFVNDPNLPNDIALLRLKRPPTLSHYVQPVCLPYGDGLRRYFDYEDTIVAGWGLTDSEKEEPSPELLGVRQKVFNGTQCVDIYKYHGIEVNATHRQVCVGGVKEKDSCNGDSGGPLMWTGSFHKSIAARVYLLGVVSLGPAKCGLEIPGVYTRVAHYMNWILDHIEP